MKVLVTGATGFIGSHLVARLVRGGYKVKALVRKKEFEKKPIDRKEGIDLLKKLKVEICFGDLLDKESLKNAFKDVELVFHLAAIARPMAIQDSLYFKVNEEGTQNLLEACRLNKKINKIVIMSSISAVGPSRNGNPVNEESECNPNETYGRSKLAQEKISLEYYKKYNLPIVILRPPMVYGARDFEMLRLFKAVNKGFFPVSSNIRGIEFVYVENLVEACLLAVKKGKNGEKYHIANSRSYSINEIVHAIAKAENKKILPIKFPKFVFVIGGYCVEIVWKIFNRHPPFKHDTVNWMTEKFWDSDISKAKRELGYNPRFSLEEGIQKTVDYYKQRGFLQ